MGYLIFWAFMSYGMTSILVWGSIFEGLREGIHRFGETNNVGKFFSDLIKCTLCTSTWVGFFISFLIGGPTEYFIDTNIVISIFFDGRFAAGSVWAINAVIEFFEESRIK